MTFRFVGLLLIVVLAPSFSCKGQTLAGEFFRLSTPEKIWTLTHPFKASNAYRTAQVVRVKLTDPEIIAACDTFQSGGRLDAFRHTYWMALLAQNIGRKAAMKLGVAHEKGNYKAFRRGKKEDGQWADSLSCEMDLRNNRSGIQLHERHPMSSSSELVSLVLHELHTGKLTMLKRNASGQLCDCFGEAVVVERRWGMPYCLIPTDSP